MTLMGLIPSAPLPTRQPMAQQVPDVTASCWQKDFKMLSHPREGEAYAPHLTRASRWRLMLSPAGQRLLHGAVVSGCSMATSVFTL